MPENPTCPTCRTPFRGTVAAGTRIVCSSCMEEFYPGQTKPTATAAPPAPSAVAAVPLATPAEPLEPLHAELVEDDPPVAPAAVAPAPKPHPKKRRRDDDDYEHDRERRDRPRRGAAPGLSPLQIGLAVAGLLLLIGTFSVGIWLATRTTEDARRPDAFAQQPQFPNDAMKAAPKAARPRDVVEPPPFNPPVIDPPQFDPAVMNPLPVNPPPPRVNPPRFEPPKPPEPEPETPLAPFKEPVIPVAAGKQTKLRELGTVKLPDVPPDPKAQPWDRKPTADVFALTFSPKHKLLFACAATGVTVYDTATGKELGKQVPKNSFMDLSLAPDESVLFVSDYGGENTGYGTPLKPSRVDRYDLKARTWEDRTAPKIAGRVETVDSHRVLLLERDQWVAVSLNLWETDGVGVRELSRTGSDYNGDMEYDPRTGRIYHGNAGISSPRISVRQVTGDKLKALGDTGSYGSASTGGGGGSVVLSRCGTRLYYGALQVDAAKVGENLKKFPEIIRAASRDIAFGSKAYYRATTSSKLGEFDFKTTSGDDRAGWGATPAVITVAPDGLSVWVIDRDKNVARQFGLEEGN
jgi:hypothetical protein